MCHRFLYFALENVIASYNNISRVMVWSFFVVTEDFTLPDLILISDTIDCNEPIGELTAISILGDSISWQGPSAFSAQNFIINPSLGGIYDAVVFGENGCEQSGTVSLVEDFNAPQVNIASSTINCDETSRLRDYHRVHVPVSVFGWWLSWPNVESIVESS